MTDYDAARAGFRLDVPERTQLVTAFVILASGQEPSAALAAELQEDVKRTTAPYKYPRLVYFVDELPKTVSSKIRPTKLRDRLRRGEPAGSSTRKKP